MNTDVKREYARMIDARRRLVEVRGERMEQLLAVRAMFRVLLGDFFETLDPITNMRLAEVTADGSKTHGDLSIALSFFEGTKLKLSVDVHGRYAHSVTVPSAFDDIERVVEIVVSSDLLRAEVVYEPVGAPGTFRSLDLIEVTMALLAHAVHAVETQLPVIPQRSVAQPRVAVAGGVSAAPRLGATVGSISRSASAVRPVRAVPDPTPASTSSDVLTLHLG